MTGRASIALFERAGEADVEIGEEAREIPRAEGEPHLQVLFRRLEHSRADLGHPARGSHAVHPPQLTQLVDRQAVDEVEPQRDAVFGLERGERRGERLPKVDGVARAEVRELGIGPGHSERRRLVVVDRHFSPRLAPEIQRGTNSHDAEPRSQLAAAVVVPQDRRPRPRAERAHPDQLPYLVAQGPVTLPTDRALERVEASTFEQPHRRVLAARGGPRQGEIRGVDPIDADPTCGERPEPRRETDDVERGVLGACALEQVGQELALEGRVVRRFREGRPSFGRAHPVMLPSGRACGKASRAMRCGDWNELDSYVAGGLDEPGRAACEAHLDGCDDCRELVAELIKSTCSAGSAEASAPLTVGDCVGRYEVREWLGEGGMGTVYRAVDPQLEREVALKLVRADLGGAVEQRAARLLREATWMARVAHPNVVSVYDAGLYRGRVYLVQELVRGSTLQVWQWRAPSAAAILERYLEAGRGLAAAHAAGLLHRDFKPQNVLVGDDGRARVTDFGLARSGDDEGPSSDAVGTPRYMAAEQRHGVATPLSDQYSFAVALAEALTATRFRTAIPKHVTRAIDRATRYVAAERYASMDALLAALSHDPLRARRRRALQLGALALCGAALAGYASYRDRAARARSASKSRPSSSRCSPRSRRRRRASCVSGPHAGRRSSTRRARPLASPVSGRRPYSSCGSRASSDNVVGRAFLASSWSPPSATRAERSLPWPAPSLAPTAAFLLGPVPPPDDPATRVRVAELRQLVDEAHAYRLADRCEEGLALARRAEEGAITLHYRPLEAEALRVEATLFNRLGHYNDAERAYRRAVWCGTAGKDDQVVLRADLGLAYQLGVDQRRYSEADAVLADARAVLERFGEDAELEGKWQRQKSLVVRMQGRLPEAEEAARQSVRLLEAALGPRAYDTLNAKKILASALVDQGKLDAAAPLLVNAVEGLEIIFLPGDPSRMAAEDDLANLRFEQDRPAEALALHRRVREQLETSRDVVHALLGEGRDLAALGHVDEAEAAYARARVLAGERLPADAREWTRLLLAEARLAWPLSASARSQLEAAGRLPAQAPSVRAEILYWLARNLPPADCERALTLAKEARELLDTTPNPPRRGEETPAMADALVTSFHCASQKP